MIEAQRIGRDREGTSDSFLLRLLPGAGLACSALGEALPLRCKGFARQNLKEKTNRHFFSNAVTFTRPI